MSDGETEGTGLGATIRQVRKRLGLTLQKVADLANAEGASSTKFTKSVLSKMERGIRSIDADQLQAIAVALDVEMFELLDPDAPPREKRSGPVDRVADESAEDVPAGERPYGPRGQALWAEHADDMLGQRGLVLLDEACRIADRLDKLDRIIATRDNWMEIAQEVVNDTTVTVIVKATPALVEARQQANTLRQLIVSLPMREAGRGDGSEDDDAWLDGEPAVGD